MSGYQRDVYVIIPAYNEGKVLAKTLAPLIAADYTIVVVDDGSNDDTWTILQDLPVIALRHHINLGQGAALQTGMTFASQRGAEFVVHFDADGQHQLKDIDTFVTILQERKAEVVLGSRFLNQEDARQVPMSKRIALKMATLVNFLFTGLLLSDAHNGFRAFTGEAAQDPSARKRLQSCVGDYLPNPQEQAGFRRVSDHDSLLDLLACQGTIALERVQHCHRPVNQEIAAMKPIQVILILVLSAGVVGCLRAFRSKLLYRVVAMGLFALCAGLVMLPDYATAAANLVGVGRGADLVTYLALLMLGYLWLLLYTRIRFLERKNTDLVRALAIENGHRAEQASSLSGADRLRKAG